MATLGLSIRILCGALLVCLAMAGTANAARMPFPAYIVLPREIPPADDDHYAFEAYGEAEFFPDAGSGEPVVQRGKHWHAETRMAGVPEDATGDAIWAKLQPGFLQAGWSVVAKYGSGTTLHLQKPGLDAWAIVSVFSRDDIRLDVVEIGAPKTALTLAAPAATPERIAAEHGDFPYLTPLPGSKFESGAQQSGPMTITLDGADEPQLVGTGTITKFYQAPGVSNVQFATAYRDALAKAGWTVLTASQGLHQSDAVVVAHYAANGRDLWAMLHATPGAYSIAVADAGARDLGSELTKSCHIALYGVLFDFDKATLKPASDTVLARVQAILAKDPGLKVEVQGHTDAVGNDAYNMTLSDSRAHAVVAWLVQRGIAADRLLAKGYGKTRPVADNDSDAGRAKNRRVEVAKIGCKAK